MATPSKSLNVLMIGNSFSICVGKYLPAIVQDIPGLHLKLTSCYIGGCSLNTHWDNVLKGESDPEFAPYGITTWETSSSGINKTEQRGNARTFIEAGGWDIITIQQASHESWHYETYQPAGDNLIAFIQKWNPQAEICIQQTWAYRADDTRILPGGDWGFDQAGMHERVRAAYHTFAQHTGFRLIPTGDAVAHFRQRVQKPFIPYTRTEILAQFTPPNVPDPSGDIVGNAGWSTPEGADQPAYWADTIHLNARGEYLQACVWFIALFHQDLPTPCFAPPELPPELTTELQTCARLAFPHAEP